MTAESPNVVELPPAARSVWKRRLLIWGGSILGTVAALILVLLYSPLLAIEQVEIEGNRLTPTARVQSELEPLLGVPLPRVGPGTVEELLADQPAVESVVIQAEAPHTLRVVIEEHQPVAVVGESGAFQMVSATGEPLAPVDERGSVELPYIEGVSAEEQPDVFATVTSVLSTLPPEVLKQMESATAQSIDSVELKLASGERVVWGNSEHGAEKAAVLAALLTVETPKGQEPVEVIDVSSPERPVTN
ncbi:cell division protein FtsQ/DivIB [Zhihengliuella sp.]|uniref:cell division protein FtsQ/DivIB n=1 Tax=Zhihengliuella sp. TaxID=1954483 RepID=UPI00281155E9|nr:cell division protein FtsQ/DivIB [Zhihengliuella sp.]